MLISERLDCPNVDNQTRQNLYNSSGVDPEKAWPRAGFNLGKHLAEAHAIDAMKL
jgi:hypothetical protein